MRVENTPGNWWGESRRRVLAYLKQQRKLNFVVLVKIFKFDWQNSKLDANMSSGVCDLLASPTVPVLCRVNHCGNIAGTKLGGLPEVRHYLIDLSGCEARLIHSSVVSQYIFKLRYHISDKYSWL